MLLWINGPFGGGKTQTAHELQRRLPGSVICDPEHVGFGLHRMLPARLRGDFQDLKAWRDGVVEVLDLALSKQDGTVIAPMTLLEPAYFAEIIGRLRESGHDVRHFALLAEPAMVRKRLRERGFGHVMRFAAGKAATLRFDSFALSKVDFCLARLSGEEFAEHIWTDRLTVPQVADQLARRSGLTLLPNGDSAVRTRLRQAKVGLKHIRFD